MEDLQELYDRYYDMGIYIKEFDEKDGYLAFAGRYHKLESAGFTSTEALDNMDLMQCNVFLAPGYSQESRSESIENAILALEDNERLGR